MTPPRKAAAAPHAEPWRPPAYDDADVAAIKALAAGNASESQQQRALAWVVNSASATYDLSFRPGASEGERATAFAEGRRFVGLQIVKMLKLRTRPQAEREQPA